MQSHHAIGGGDVMKRCALLVPKHHFRNPDSIPSVVLQFERRAVVVGGAVKAEPRVEPLLAEIHAQRIVLYACEKERNRRISSAGARQTCTSQKRSVTYAPLYHQKAFDAPKTFGSVQNVLYRCGF